MDHMPSRYVFSSQLPEIVGLSLKDIELLIDFGVFTFAHYYLGWRILIANGVAWIIAVTNSYLMNSLTTFAAESGRRLRVKDYGIFVASQVGGLIANTLTVYALTAFMLQAWIAKLAAIGVTFLVNFSLSHFVVFRKRTTDDGRKSTEGEGAAFS